MGCSAEIVGYNHLVRARFHVGDVIQKAREERRWNQERLGAEAAYYGRDGRRLPKKADPIDKSTVSTIERDPYASKLTTILRLLSALGLSWSDVFASVHDPTRHESPPPLETGSERVKRTG